MRITVVDSVLLLVSVLSLPIPLLIYFRNRKNEANFSFAVFAFSGALWAFVIAMFRMSLGINEAWFWNKAIYLVGNLPAVAFLYFSFVFPKKEKPMELIKKIVIAAPLVFFPYLILFQTRLFITNIFLSLKHFLTFLF